METSTIESLNNYYIYNDDINYVIVNYKGIKVPLFSAIAFTVFDIADLLIKYYVDINYSINYEGKTINIINYLSGLSPL